MRGTVFCWVLISELGYCTTKKPQNPTKFGTEMRYKLKFITSNVTGLYRNIILIALIFFEKVQLFIGICLGEPIWSGSNQVIEAFNPAISKNPKFS
ncbi:MAG TPA: hypothetical protein PLB46_14545, partial [Chitinophagales bacterium]|nr:hypothetical protein [Chitinophagales bacterium]